MAWGGVDLVMTLVVVLLIPEACIALCSPSSCGSIRNISHPFRLKGDPDNCGDKRFELSCENNRTTLYLPPAKYYVLDITYPNSTYSAGRMRVVDARIDHDDICSLPSYPFNARESPYAIDNYWDDGDYHQIVILNCTKPLTNSSRYVDFTPCFNQSLSTPIKTYHYASTFNFRASDWPQHCFIIPILPYTTTNITAVTPASRIHQQLLAGFQLYWYNKDYYSEPCDYYSEPYDYLW